MKAFVTGGTGFIGSHLIDRLLERGDQVTALVRSEKDAEAMRAQGVTPVLGDIRDRESMRAGMAGSDVVFHTAAWYKIGAKDWQAAEEINVQGTRNVVSLAQALGVPRIVYTSTVAIYGNTRGQVLDETSPAPEGPFDTEYDRTKWRAHFMAAVPLIEQGAPVIIVQPGAVYGPGDRSSLAEMMEWFYRGWFPIFPAPEMALQFAYIDDIVEGHILAAERGQPGESYILAGPPATMRQMVALWAKITGRPAPLLYAPPALVKRSAPLLGLLGRFFDLPTLLSAESARISGSTYLASAEKARRALGWNPRPIEEGMRQTFAELGKTVDAPAPEAIERRFQTGKILAAMAAGILVMQVMRGKRKAARMRNYKKKYRARQGG